MELQILDGIRAAVALNRRLAPGRKKLRPTYLFKNQAPMGQVPASLLERLRNANGQEVHATPEELAVLHASRPE